MTSTTTFADKLRELTAATTSISIKDRNKQLSKSFWRDIKKQLGAVAIEGRYCAKIKVDEDIHEGVIIKINESNLLLKNVSKKVSNMVWMHMLYIMLAGLNRHVSRISISNISRNL